MKMVEFSDPSVTETFHKNRLRTIINLSYLSIALFIIGAITSYVTGHLHFIILFAPFFLLGVIELILTRFKAYVLSSYFMVYGFMGGLALSAILLGNGYYIELGLIITSAGGFVLFHEVGWLKWLTLVLNLVTYFILTHYFESNPAGILLLPFLPVLSKWNIVTIFILICLFMEISNVQNIEINKVVTTKNKELSVKKEIIEQQADKLRQLDKKKSDFFANIAHELRTPLTLLLGPARLLLKKQEEGTEDKTLLSLIEKNGVSLLSLTNQILDLTKIDAGILEVHLSTVEIDRFTRSIYRNFVSVAETKAIRFHFDNTLHKGLKIYTDANKLKTILVNLLSNAFKFTPSSGVVILRLLERDNNLLFMVTDTGRGLGPNEMPHVFDRYYQSSALNAPVEGGAGIGLAICQEYAGLLEGAVSVKSKQGEGASFTLSIPLNVSTESIVQLEESREVGSTSTEPDRFDPPSVKSGGHQSILIIEDNQDIVEYLKVILKNAGYWLHTATNGKQAFEVIENLDKPPNLVLCDIMMPEMDGYQFMEHFKGLDEYRHVPIIVLTAKSGKDDKIKFLRIGVDDYIVKPFDQEELLARVHNLLVNVEERNQYQSSLKKQIEKGTYPQSQQEKMQGHVPIISKADAEWLEELEEIVLKHLSNFDLSVDILSKEIAMSHASLFRKTKSLLGLTPIQYVNQVRFREALKMLEEGRYPTVKAVAYSVGFKAEKNFSRNFKKRFGKYPSDYL